MINVYLDTSESGGGGRGRKKKKVVFLEYRNAS